MRLKILQKEYIDSIMRILTESDMESLKTRGYLNSSNLTEGTYDILNNLSSYNISPEPYLLLFRGLDPSGIRNITRFICLNWQNVATSLNDISIEFANKQPEEICEFFLSDSKKNTHRVCFFVEIVYQYFFP